MTDYSDVPVVYVKWKDHFSVVHADRRWIDLEELTSPQPYVMINTIGFLMHEDDDSYRVALSVDGEGHINGNIIILKATVVEYKELHVNDRMGKRKKTD